MFLIGLLNTLMLKKVLNNLNLICNEKLDFERGIAISRL